jgi:hypothetical protein
LTIEKEKIVKRSSTLLGLFLTFVLFVGFVAGRAHAAQSHMVAARNHLRAARHNLELALPDKGGHRERAIGIIDNAIGEVDAGIEYSRAH